MDNTGLPGRRVINASKTRLSTDTSRDLAREAHGRNRFVYVLGWGGWVHDRMRDYFPSRLSQHARNSKDTAVPPQLSLRDRSCRCQLSQSKESAEPARIQIFRQDEALFSWPGAWVSHLLLGLWYRAACIPDNASSPSLTEQVETSLDEVRSCSFPLFC